MHQLELGHLQDAAEVLKTAQAAVNAPKASLGAFGSIIRSAMDEQAVGGKVPASPPAAPVAKPASPQETKKPVLYTAQKAAATSKPIATQSELFCTKPVARIPCTSCLQTKEAISGLQGISEFVLASDQILAGKLLGP